jgi:hypothetical protein
LLGDDQPSQARIELTTPSPARQVDRRIATAALVRDLDDMTYLLQPHGKHQTLPVNQAGRAAPIPTLAQLTQRGEDTGASADDFRQADRRITHGVLKALHQRSIAHHAPHEPQATADRRVGCDALHHAERTLQGLVDAEQRHRVAHGTIVSGAHQAFVVGEAGTAEIAE